MTLPFHTMTEDEIAEFLAEPRHALVATVRSAGAPQLSPVWFLFEDGVVYFSVQSTGAKQANLRRDPRVAICVDAGHPDARSVTFVGEVVLHARDGRDLLRRIARRYLSSDADTDRYLAEATASSDLLLVSLRPDKTLARDYN